ncbi:DUF433 domain-containing protein [Limnochorda pilosa]|uniref:DUF433 domain-containing protein n=1 Tax=Limnochorda pilosa TaxID=1555112 RepID=UPI0009E9E0DF
MPADARGGRDSPAVLAGLAEGSSVEDILRSFPSLTEEDVRAVIAFAAASAEEDLPVSGLPAGL